MATLDVGDASIWYDQMGSGRDLVWVPGGDQPGSDWHLYQVPHFAGRYRNTTFDPRGVGRTVAPAAEAISIAGHASDVAALIEALCDPPVVVIGLSMGSLITQELCLSYPELVRCGIAMGTSGSNEAGLFGIEWMRSEVAFRRNGGSLPEDFAITHYGVFMYPSEVLGDPELWAKVRPVVANAYGRRDGVGLAAQWEGCSDFSSEDRLPGCTVPLHVIGFSQDVQAPPGLGRRVAELAPQGQFHLLEGLGHCSAFGHKPEVVNECIDEILAIVGWS
jgi:pimeloyl-ACP methyl ester carboxylesterase